MKRRYLLLGQLGAALGVTTLYKAEAQTPMQLNIAGTLAQWDQLLSTDLARVGVDSIVRTVYTFRRQFRPTGHETTGDWDKRFNESLVEFQETLWSPTLLAEKNAVLADKEAIAAFETAFAKNASKFVVFHAQVAGAKSAPDYVRRSLPETLARGQLLFAVVLRARSAESLRKAASITAIWPFCG